MLKDSKYFPAFLRPYKEATKYSSMTNIGDNGSHYVFTLSEALYIPSLKTLKDKRFMDTTDNVVDICAMFTMSSDTNENAHFTLHPKQRVLGRIFEDIALDRWTTLFLTDVYENTFRGLTINPVVFHPCYIGTPMLSIFNSSDRDLILRPHMPIAVGVFFEFKGEDK